MRRTDRLAITTVDDVMQRWPATLGVFIRFGMKCIGCPIAPFHSVEDACREHALAEEKVLAALIGVIDGDEGEAAQASVASSASSTSR